VDRLWSPWRMEYIESANDPSDGCIFCDLPERGDDRDARILARTPGAFAILNTYPYNPGHLMIAPFRHSGELAELSDEEDRDVDGLLRRSVAALRSEMSPQGFNVGMNLGRVAGAGIPDHLHWHVVPRWNGDTNFMPVIGETRVMPELLDETYDRLVRAFAEP
jgi:ATP adenylyltransferase